MGITGDMRCLLLPLNCRESEKVTDWKQHKILPYSATLLQSEFPYLKKANEEICKKKIMKIFELLMNRNHRRHAESFIVVFFSVVKLRKSMSGNNTEP